MQIGIIGLGRMGGNIARRLMKAGHECVVFDANAKPREKLAEEGATAVGSLERMVNALGEKPCAVWVMLPAGRITDETVERLGGLLEPDDIIIDAKSGVSGAGRDAKLGSLYAEVTEGIHAYGVAGHRHAPEIEQGLSEAAGKPIVVNFTPHLMPMSRGILSSIYVRLHNDAKVEDLRQTLESRYKDEPFVRLLPAGRSPQTRHVRGSNHCLIGLFADRVPGRAILISVLDNLVKGASGQAVQNMNLMAGLPETAGLEQEPLFP